MQNFDELFPQDSDILYLNHAAVGPWPACTAEAVAAFANECVVSGASYYPKWMETEATLRKELAKLISINDTDEISLAKSTSEALSIIAYGIEWEEGDEILISNQEFPSNRIVWESLSRYGVKLTEVDITGENASDPVAAFQNAISDSTKLVSVSTVQYASGLKMDAETLGAVCRKNNVLLCLDAIQSLGASVFDQTKIEADFIVADGHKWMLGPEGLALLFVKRGIRNTLDLKQYGWHMVQARGDYDRHDWEPASDGTRFECGSPNMLGIHALNASLSLLNEIGMNTVERELQLRIDYLIEHIKNNDSFELISPTETKKRGGIVTFKVKDINQKQLHQKLMKQGLICAYRGGGIRLSPHFYTLPEVMDRALEILETQISL